MTGSTMSLNDVLTMGSNERFNHAFKVPLAPN